LVTTADLSRRKTAQLTLGDGTQGIDLDEFVSKCITFMRRGPSEEEEDTPTGRVIADGEEILQTTGTCAQEDSADEGDAFNWEYLGRRLCFPTISAQRCRDSVRPVIGTEASAQTDSTPRATQKRNPADVVRPEELQKADLEKAENSI
jgi:hypothetical protein